MPNLKRYSTTKATALALGMDTDDTSVSVSDGSTYPDPNIGGNGPYTIIIGYGSDREEICTVTAKPSPHSFTVTRAQDGSIASSKNIGDVVVHGVSKRDWEDMLDKTVGGTMAGDLTLAGAPTTDLMAATKKYVDDGDDAVTAHADSGDALLLPKAGGTMTGAIILAGAPTVDLNPATKKYVDDADALKAPLASPTFTGNVVVPTADADGEAVNKGQMDAAIVPVTSNLTYSSKSSQSIPNATWTKPSGEDVGRPAGAYPSSISAGRWTCPVDGIWILEFHAFTVANITLWVRIVESLSERGGYSAARPTGGSYAHVIWMRDLPSGSVIDFSLYQNSGSSQTCTTTITATYLGQRSL